MFLVITTSPHRADPLWEEMEGLGAGAGGGTGNRKPKPEATLPGRLQDSGVGSSLSCTPQAALADLNVSRESGELTNQEDTPLRGCIQQAPPLPDNGYIRGSVYVAGSLAERMVLEHLPAPQIDK